jgi:hypothetical protein
MRKPLMEQTACIAPPGCCMSCHGGSRRRRCLAKTATEAAGRGKDRLSLSCMCSSDGWSRGMHPDGRRRRRASTPSGYGSFASTRIAINNRDPIFYIIKTPNILQIRPARGPSPWSPSAAAGSARCLRKGRPAMHTDLGPPRILRSRG